jgi:hypothetical protein
LDSLILRLSPHGFWALVLGGAAASAAGFYLVFHWLRHLRLVADTPTASIRSAAQGYAEFEGQAQMMDGEPILAPLSGTPCVWYRYAVKFKPEGRNDWRTVEQGDSGAIFHLDDGTGSCIVDPDGAKVIPSVRLNWRGQHRRPGFGPRGGWFERWLNGGPYRYTEERIDEGDSLYALGWFAGLPGADPATPNEEVRDLLARWKRDPVELKRRFDGDGDRQISLEEWERAREEAARQVTASWHEQSASDEAPLLRKPGDGRPFVLSTRPQADLARRLRGKILLAGAVFLGAGSLVIYAWNVRFGS